jgi:hypothetical protein
MPILFMANEGNPNCVIIEMFNPGEDVTCAYGLLTLQTIAKGEEVITASNCQLLAVTASNCQ